MVKAINYGERIMRLETKLDSVDKKVDKIDCKFDKFTDKCDNTYATKKELRDVKETLVAYDRIQDDSVKNRWAFIEKNWFGIITVIAFIIYTILKGRGLI